MGAINLTDKATQLTKSYSISLMSVDALTPDRPRRARPPSLRRAVHSGAVPVAVIVVVVLVHGTLTPRPVLLGVEVVHVDL